MENIYTGKTLEAALENAEKELGINKEEFTYEILEYPSKGFLGIGSKPAKVRISYEVSPEKMIENYINGLFALCGISGHTINTSIDGEYVNVQVDGEEASLFVTKQFDTVEAMQMLISLSINKELDKHYKVSLNINDYKEKTKTRLEALAMKIADQVQKSHRKVTLNAMSSYQRRIIHSKLQDVENITTFSVGEEPNRKVVIAYNGPDAERKPRKFTPPSERKGDLKKGGKKGGNKNRGDRKPKEFVPQEMSPDVKPFFPIYKPEDQQ
ncbi:MAG: Jag N-terminal domain-containing protein [Clostridia bacterium]|nr:Jag N-terminal domain-containing protein [Clostridia bacterium]